MSAQGAIERIRKLLSKTTENGCTEAEAMSAARVAARLMDQHNLSAADLLAGQTAATDALFERTGIEHAVIYVAKAVGSFTNCKIFMDTRAEVKVEKDLFGGGKATKEAINKLRIVGLAHEVEVARYVLEICYVAMEAAAAKALMSENEERTRHDEPQILGNERKRWVADFQRGMAHRMSETLDEMTGERRREVHASGSGRDLIVVRNQLVDGWFEERGMRLRNSNSRGSIKHRSAFGAGQNAGGNVRFHSGVSSGQRGQMALR